MTNHRIPRPVLAAASVAVAASLALGACSSGSGSSSTADGNSTTASIAAGSSDQVLPVTSNPIENTATAPDLHIDSVLVENNEDGAGNPVDDHLEIAVSNSGSSDLSGFEVYTTFTDQTTGDTESYYTQLPADFTVAPGATRTIHFDDTGATDHFPANPYSLYATSTNALDVEVQVSAQGAAVQTATVTKDAGGAEVAD